MKKKKNEQVIETESPQKSLEKILKTEIQVAQEISAAKGKADSSINAARDEVGTLKENILKKAREEREQTLADGIDTANQEAQKAIAKAEQNSKRFFDNGKKFIDEAVRDVIRVVLDDEDGSK